MLRQLITKLREEVIPSLAIPDGFVGTAPYVEREKKCTDCMQRKPLSEYQRNVTSRDGKRSQCKACTNLKQRMKRRTFVKVPVTAQSARRVK